MLKRLIFCLWILLPFSLFAQNEEESSTAHDSLSTEKHQGAFMKAIKKFLNFNDFDTTYISPFARFPDTLLPLYERQA